MNTEFRIMSSIAIAVIGSRAMRDSGGPQSTRRGHRSRCVPIITRSSRDFRDDKVRHAGTRAIADLFPHLRWCWIATIRACCQKSLRASQSVTRGNIP
jgi:hypothetical protein